jgi:hypothetical protein
MVYEMVAGRSAWEYSSDSFPSIEKYFELITQFTKEKLQKDSFLPCSSELKDLLRYSMLCFAIAHSYFFGRHIQNNI